MPPNRFYLPYVPYGQPEPVVYSIGFAEPTQFREIFVEELASLAETGIKVLYGEADDPSIVSRVHSNEPWSIVNAIRAAYADGKPDSETIIVCLVGMEKLALDTKDINSQVDELKNKIAQPFLERDSKPVPVFVIALNSHQWYAQDAAKRDPAQKPHMPKDFCGVKDFSEYLKYRATKAKYAAALEDLPGYVQITEQAEELVRIARPERDMSMWRDVFVDRLAEHRAKLADLKTELEQLESPLRNSGIIN